MDGAKDLVRQAADIFHDVNLTGLGPTDPVNIGAQAPESRPQPGSAGNLDAGFNAAISDFKLIFRQ